MSYCDESYSNILLYLGDELSGQEFEDFRVHLRECPDCRTRLEEEEALSRRLHNSRPLYSASENSPRPCPSAKELLMRLFSTVPFVPCTQIPGPACCSQTPFISQLLPLRFNPHLCVSRLELLSIAKFSKVPPGPVIWLLPV